MLDTFTTTYVKFFFLLTPFFLLSTFLSLTRDFTPREKKITALKTTASILVVSIFLILFGKSFFNLFGITLDSFRIGTGILLFFSAIDLVRGKGESSPDENLKSIFVVPLAIPVGVGPATTGALMVLSSDMSGVFLIPGIAGMTGAIISVGIFLFVSSFIERVVGKNGLVVLSKITGLILSALAAQLVMQGVTGFLPS